MSEILETERIPGCHVNTGERVIPQWRLALQKDIEVGGVQTEHEVNC